MTGRTVSAVTLLDTVGRGVDAAARMLARDAEVSARYGIPATPTMVVEFTAARCEWESLLRGEWNELAGVAYLIARG